MFQYDALPTWLNRFALEKAFPIMLIALCAALVLRWLRWPEAGQWCAIGGVTVASVFAFYVVSGYQLDLGAHDSEALSSILRYDSSGGQHTTKVRFGLSAFDAWMDANRNGIRDVGEQGLAGANVYFLTEVRATSGLQVRWTRIEPGSSDRLHQRLRHSSGDWIADLVTEAFPEGRAVVEFRSAGVIPRDPTTPTTLEDVPPGARFVVARFATHTDESGRYPDPLVDHRPFSTSASSGGVVGAAVVWDCTCDNIAPGQYVAFSSEFVPSRDTLMDPHRTLTWILVALIVGALAAFLVRHERARWSLGALALVGGTLVQIFRRSKFLYWQHPGFGLVVAGVCIGMLAALASVPPERLVSRR
jgi:hypothetical protein